MVAAGAFVTVGTHATILKFARRTTGTKIVPAKLFGQLFVSMDNAVASFDMSFGRESFPALTHYLKS